MTRLLRALLLLYCGYRRVWRPLVRYDRSVEVGDLVRRHGRIHRVHATWRCDQTCWLSGISAFLCIDRRWADCEKGRVIWASPATQPLLREFAKKRRRRTWA